MERDVYVQRGALDFCATAAKDEEEEEEEEVVVAAVWWGGGGGGKLGRLIEVQAGVAEQKSNTKTVQNKFKKVNFRFCAW
jgi:hypothetical protein